MAPATECSPFRIAHTVCSHDCPDSYSVLVTVDETGRAIKVRGDPAHPVTHGFLRGKVAKYLDRAYTPERILYPLNRRPGAQLDRAKMREGGENVNAPTSDRMTDIGAGAMFYSTLVEVAKA